MKSLSKACKIENGYLVMQPVSLPIKIFTSSLCIMAFSFFIGFIRNCQVVTENNIHFLTGMDNLMAWLLGSGLMVGISGLLIPYFFIKAIEISDKGIVIENVDVPYSLKKFSAGNNVRVFIQFYLKGKKYVYATTSKNELEWETKAEGINFPETDAKKRLISVLERNKKNAKVIFFPLSIKIAAVLFVMMLILTCMTL